MKEGSKGKGVWLGLALLLLGGLALSVGARYGQSLVAIVAGVTAMLVGIITPVVAVGQRIGHLIDDQLAKLRRAREESEERDKRLETELVMIDPARDCNSTSPMRTDSGKRRLPAMARRYSASFSTSTTWTDAVRTAWWRYSRR